MAYKYFEVQKPTTPETGIGKLTRNVISSGAKAISDAAGFATLPFKLQQSAQQAGQESLQQSLNNSQVPAALKTAGQRILQESSRSELANPSDIYESASELAQQPFPDNYLQPQSENEEMFQDYASLIPGFLLGGGSFKDIPSFLGKVFAGRKVGEHAKESGYGEAGRIASEIAVPALLTSLNPNRLKEYFTDIQQKDYNEVLPQLAEGKFIDAKSFENELIKVSETAKRKAGASRHLKNLNDWMGEIQDGKLPLSRLQPLKAEINELVYDMNGKVYQPLSHALTKMGKESIKEFPEYGHALKRADHITKLFKNTQSVKDFVDKTTKSIPVTVGRLAKKGISLVFDNPIVSTTRNITSLAQNFPKETADYASKMFQAASKQQASALINYATKLGKLVEDSEDNKYTYFEV